MLKIFIDKVRLGSAHSLKVGHTPEKLNMEVVANNNPNLDIAVLGLFEVATPNFNTYYPNVTKDDLVLKDGDFILPIFRALSEVIVNRKYNPIDFSANNVLKNSMNKLLGQTVYPNHEPIVGNEIGSVAKVSWQKEYKLENGIIVPAGINAQFKIDAKSNPKIARSILMDPPSIHSNSVTITFGWERSHPSMDINEFWSKLGTFGADGQLIRRVATEVHQYHETSLVAHGADPFAQKVVDGKIVNPDYAHDSYTSLSALGEGKTKSYFFDYKEDVISLTSIPTNLNHINNNSEPMKELIAKLALKYKKPEAEITEAFIQTLIESGETAITNLSTVTSEKDTLKTELATEKGKVTLLTTELDAEKVKVSSGTTELGKVKPLADEYTTKLRSEVERVYGVLKGDKADAPLVASFKTLDHTALNALMKDYNTELEEKFPASCQSCGSKEITRNSASITNPDPNKEKDKESKLIKSDAEVAAELKEESKGSYLFDKKA